MQINIKKLSPLAKTEAKRARKMAKRAKAMPPNAGIHRAAEGRPVE